MRVHDEFTWLDDFGLACATGRCVEGVARREPIQCLGPVVELLYRVDGSPHASQFRQLGSLVHRQTAEQVNTALGNDFVGTMGALEPCLFEATRSPAYSAAYSNKVQWTAFCKRFDLSARNSGCSTAQGYALAAAMRELVSNVHDHSRAVTSCFVAYKASPGSFEFVVADAGIGVLASLRTNPDLTGLRTPSSALAALLQGESRHGTRGGHGHGYRKVFKVLQGAAGYIRCRSDTATLTMSSGCQPRIDQRPNWRGLIVSVTVGPEFV